MHSLLFRFDVLRRTAPIAMLLLLLQRSPMIQLLLRGGNTGAPNMVVNLLRTALLATAGGLTHTLTGATKFNTTPATPATGTVGTAFSMAFSVTGAPSTPKSYKIAGTLPPGLTVTGINASGVVNASTGSITGTPTTAGAYSFTIQAWEFINAAGEKSPLYPVSITITGGAAVAPSITTQPTGSTVTAGGNASFSVSASGTATLTYQWRKDGTNISGATSSSLSLTNVQSTDAGTYTVVVTNLAGSVTSSGATLTVNAAAVAPTISSQPASTSATVGGSASFSVTASGTATLSYQWKKDGANISGATSSSLSLSNVQSTDAGTYTVVVTNSAGSVTSSGATLTVSAAAVAPSISSQPASTSATVGGSASFSVTASGTATLTYQWKKDGANISGATASSLSLTNVQNSDAGTYTVVVTNLAGSATSSGATLTVSAAAVAPSISSQPTSTSATVGGSASFSVTASGTATLTYQWKKDGANISGATSSSLSLTNVQSTDAGTYTVVVTNSAGSVTSSGATLTVNSPGGGAPVITSAPQELHLPAGYSGSFTVVATGGAPLAYQWYRNGTAISGATSATYTVSNAQTSQAGNITVTVSNSSGNATSPAVPLVVGTNTGRLSAISVRAFVGNGANVLVPGIAVSASAPKTVLIRAVGPGLIPLGVGANEVLIDPVITVYSGSTVVATNDDWESAANASTLPAVFQTMGNFALPAGSKDAVVLIALPAGVYTAVVSGKNGGTGVALVEVYEVN